MTGPHGTPLVFVFLTDT